MGTYTTSGGGIGSVSSLPSYGPPLTQQQILQQQAQILQAHQGANAYQHPNSPSLSDMLVNFILMRMRGVNPTLHYQSLPNKVFDFISAHKVNDENYVVFLVVRGEALVIHDDALFPSDRLVTQLRLLSNGVDP